MLTHPSPAWLDLHLHQSAERRRAQFCKYTVPSYNFEYVQGPHAYNYKAPLWIWYFLFGQSCIFLNDNLWLKCKVDVGWYKMQDKSRTSLFSRTSHHPIRISGCISTFSCILYLLFTFFFCKLENSVDEMPLSSPIRLFEQTRHSPHRSFLSKVGQQAHNVVSWRFPTKDGLI